MRRASKKDETQDERILDMLSLGLDVVPTHWSAGKLLDCVVGHPATLKRVFVEIKNNDKAKYTDDEIKFMSAHPGQFRTVRSKHDVRALWEELRR